MLYKTDNPHGGDIYEGAVRIDFSANINPLGPPPGVKAAMHEAVEKIAQYPDPYCRRLTEKISAAEEVPEEYILCGAGAAELIYSYFFAVMPKKTAETAPTFSEYSSAAEKHGAKVFRHRLFAENDFDIERDITKLLKKEKPNVLVLCNPNNPTGRLIGASLAEELLYECEKIGTRLFVDECFLDLTLNGETMKPYLEKHKNLFILKAFTKSYALAGARIGFCMTSDKELLKKMSDTVQPWNVSSLAQAAGEASLEEKEYLKRAAEYVAAERQKLKKELESFGFWVCPSEANYLLFRAEENLDKRLKENGIYIRNCANYHGLGAGWFRTAVRTSEENKILTDAIKSVKEE